MKPVSLPRGVGGWVAGSTHPLCSVLAWSRVVLSPDLLGCRRESWACCYPPHSGRLGLRDFWGVVQTTLPAQGNTLTGILKFSSACHACCCCCPRPAITSSLNTTIVVSHDLWEGVVSEASEATAQHGWPWILCWELGLLYPLLEGMGGTGYRAFACPSFLSKFVCYLGGTLKWALWCATWLPRPMAYISCVFVELPPVDWLPMIKEIWISFTNHMEKLVNPTNIMEERVEDPKPLACHKNSFIPQSLIIVWSFKFEELLVPSTVWVAAQQG